MTGSRKDLRGNISEHDDAIVARTKLAASPEFSWWYHAVFLAQLLLIAGYWWWYPMMGHQASQWLLVTANVWVGVTLTQTVSPELSPANRIFRRLGRWFVWGWLCLIVVLTIVLPCLFGPPTE